MESDIIKKKSKPYKKTGIAAGENRCKRITRMNLKVTNHDLQLIPVTLDKQEIFNK